MAIDLNNASKLTEIIMAFYKKNDYQDLLEYVLQTMMELTDADGGTLYVLEDQKLHFRILRNLSMGVEQGIREQIDLPPIVLDEHHIDNVSAFAAIKNEFVIIDDVYNNADFNFSGPKKYDKMTGYRTQSMLVFPLATRDEDNDSDVIGVIQLINAMDKFGRVKPFESEIGSLRFLHALSNISANALSNLLYAKEVRDLFHSFVQVMTTAIDERSSYTSQHTNNVAMYCNLFAKFLQERFPREHPYYFSGARQEKLVLAALLHDIGKVVTPLEIMDKSFRLNHHQFEAIQYKFQIKAAQLEVGYLKHQLSQAEYAEAMEGISRAFNMINVINKSDYLSDDALAEAKKLAHLSYVDADGIEVPILTPADMDALAIRKGTLTASERAEMQMHVVVTSRLLDKITFKRFYKDVPKWASGHHEFLDGSGYPLGLSGDQIPIETCILTIMDIYEALTANDRPYKKGLSPEKSLSLLLRMADEGKLNKEMVQLFFESNVWKLAAVSIRKDEI